MLLEKQKLFYRSPIYEWVEKRMLERPLAISSKELAERLVQELLGWVLIALYWPNVTDDDRVALLHLIDILERLLIELKNDV